ncbi:MAG: hypothetical protein JNJ54_30215 [Myxococcaceae bacterium]|nr:hypothetical protein [Myxococcaceae bacterium]
MDGDAWERAAGWLERSFPESPGRAERIHWLTVPVALWLLHHVRAKPSRPLLAGLNAPQGAGKTTLTGALVGLLHDVFGLRVVSISIDDFYLRRQEQLALAAAHPGNRFLEHRGYPGTHDVALGESVLRALSEGRDVDVPRYDKSAHGGRGDRSVEVTPVHGSVDLVLVEGWMLGFEPVERVPEPALAAPNAMLRDYARWTRLLEVLVCLRMADPRQVIRWRIEAEAAMRASGRPGLSDAEVEDYVRRFLPAYETWGPTVGRATPGDRLLALTLDASRTPVP